MKRQVLQFSEPLKQAILDGYKVQTRRIVKPQPTQPTTIWYADASDSGKWVAMGRPAKDRPNCARPRPGSAVPTASPARASCLPMNRHALRQRGGRRRAHPAPAKPVRGRRPRRGHAGALSFVVAAAWRALQTAFALNWCERYGTHAWAANPWVWVVEFRRRQDGLQED